MISSSFPEEKKHKLEINTILEKQVLIIAILIRRAV